ncbi:hypothetical protein ACFWNI_02425 [Streptomyces sp. NPDC058377]|uniref:hypothetical protein n=1 Tax=Streptomyces sp. NPDC058377 TaxID=3346468 RepID=UPI003657518F
MIEIGKVGRITAGDELGKFVRIKELPDDPPSYLILLAEDSEFLNGCGDYWVENREDLEEFFIEAHWEVEWTNR